jgi:hypothetical protein
LNNGIFVVRSFENLHYTNLSKLMQESTEILMNETSESFYPLDMFEFIHHPQYGCHDLKGLIFIKVPTSMNQLVTTPSIPNYLSVSIKVFIPN